MWRRPRRKIFKVVMTHHRSQVFGANSHPRHPRITIRISEIDMAGDKSILAIRATRSEHERSQRDQLRKQRDSAEHPPIRNPPSEIRNGNMCPPSLRYGGAAFGLRCTSKRSQKWRRANSRPEPLFKYFSNSCAFSSDLKAIAVSIRQGRFLRSVITCSSIVFLQALL